ncbi:hypothetical protein BTM426_02490 [Helicobacter pylori]
MAYKPSKKKLQTLREEPNLFSILDDGNVINTSSYKQEPEPQVKEPQSSTTQNPNKEQETPNYVVKFKSNKMSMISRNPIEWARYLSFGRRVHKDNSKEDVNFFANGEIKESSRVYEANEEGFERCITKRYDLIDTIRNKEFFSKEIDTLTYTNSLEELKEQGLEIESLSSYDENGNLIAPSKKELENELKEKEAKSVNLDEELAKSCSFDVYSDVLRHLVQMGIPQNEIAFIHDAKTEEQKQDLFKKLNRGEVRILLGSPAKMGVGTNVQERLVAMHELDCPWRPDELLQMEGRGIRQGNILHQNDPENFRMKIYRYATEKTYDSRMWQIIETKSKGIEQFRNAHKLGLNELEDFNMGSSNASEMKAEATGNPLIIEEVKLRAEIKNEEAKYKAFNKENYFNEENLKNNSSKLDYLKQELKDLETLQSSVMIPIHTEIKLYDLKNEESKDYELIKVKEVEPLKENASMSEELTHKKLKEQNKQIAEQNKEKLDAIKKQFASNLNDLFFNEERDCKLLEYKGFVVNAYKTKYQVEFSLSPKDNPNIAYSPSNMIYKNDTANMFSSYNFCAEIKFDGFLKRLDNAITKLPEKIKELENSIETTQENIAKYTRLVEQKPSYPRLEYLQALKWDHKTLIDDLAKMSKDRDYKPVFNPKSQEVLEKMNAEKRASLENESVTITEIENSNKEQEIKGNTKSDDEVKQHIEQVIEKEIGKGAEIISSKEVAITNNVDYYENEEELETTQSRSRR